MVSSKSSQSVLSFFYCFFLLLNSFLPSVYGAATLADWQSLKQELHGNLQSARPLAEPCFPHPIRDNISSPSTSCSDVQRDYLNASYRTSIYPGFFHTYNEGCVSNATDQCLLSPDDPLSAVSGTCQQGLVSEHFIEVRSAQDVQVALAFARRTGLSLSLKASGHDYLGRSSIKGSLALWTRNLKQMTYHPSYPISDKTENGTSSVRAVTLGAGVNLGEAYLFADQHAVTLVGGSSPTVTVSGGWTLLGGHSVLSPLYGMGVDRVLEFTVVTPDGDLRTANAHSNPDLFWALRGAGAAAFGVVLSTTIKVEPAMPLTLASISFPATPNNQLPFLELLINESTSWASQGWGGPLGSSYAALVHPGLLDLNATAKTFSTIANYARLQQPQAAPTTGPSTSQTNGTASTGAAAPAIQYVHFPSWLAFYTAVIAPSANNGISQPNFANFRVVRRHTHRASSPGRARLLALFASLLDEGLSPQILQTPPHLFPYEQGSTSAHPAWRDSYWMVGTSLQYTWNATDAERQGNATLLQTVSRQLVAAAPDGAHYPNEADPWLKAWREEFWGQETYKRLLEVKRKYDPEGLMGCWKCVGFEEEEGRRSKGGEKDQFGCWDRYRGLA
ncbi:MAG: hypothetical protein LQ348_000447 [Seirophora lacunosa]|nr:MAG: hypothetical protein LQ348_000447 [Seirophora lacunosa]